MVLCRKTVTSSLYCTRQGDLQWESIDVQVAEYRRVGGFQEVTLAIAAEHLTGAPAPFPTELAAVCAIHPGQR